VDCAILLVGMVLGDVEIIHLKVTLISEERDRSKVNSLIFLV